ncbi:MAG: hypothetical protein M3270_11595 [Thermoproteota archaeon]|nr:hypothetical protein [Thermoproteota archaeon]
MRASDNDLKQIRYDGMTSILIAVHAWRLVGIAFLWGMILGVLDPAFAIPAGIGDILIGITAIPFAIFLSRGYSWSKYAIVIWTVLGIADLINAVSLGIITNDDFNTSTMSTFPWILIPTLGVPSALVLHGITLYRLKNWLPRRAHNKFSEA